MKFLIAAAIAASTLLAQDAKVLPPKDVAPTVAPKAPNPERAWTEVETLKFQLADEKIRRLREQFHIDEFNKQVTPLSGEQTGILVALCKSIGIPEPLVQQQCGLETGLDQDGKVKIGPDSKPVTPRVWWQKPAAAASSAVQTKPVPDK